MQVAIIKYNAGNIYSVDCALKRVGVDAVITDDEEVLKSSDKIIFPGWARLLLLCITYGKRVWIN